MAKKIQLEHRSDPVFFTIFGISCHSRDYQLVYHLKNLLGFGFAKMDDFHGHPLYYYKDNNDFNAYYLLGNRGSDSVLLTELRQTDYIFLLEGPVKKPQKEHLFDTIRKAPGVLTGFEIRFGMVRNLENLLNDLELHFMKIKSATIRKYSPLKQ